MKPTRAVLLVRISDDKAQDAKGVGRQEDDGRALAERLGWTITEVVVENDTSAYKRRKIKLPDGSAGLRTVRPGFRAVLDKLSSGECDGLLAYDLDRVARDPRDLEDLIDVVESRRPLIPVESVSGSLRLADDSGITMARVMVAVANKSSRDTARRVARKHEELAKEGKWNGGGFRGFGFDTKGHAVIEDEAKILREIGARILGDWDGWTVEQRKAIDPELGESLHSIAADLQRREIPTVTGAAWSGRSVSSAVSKPSVAGLRAHRGEVVSTAVWGAVIPVERWEQVCERLAMRAGDTDLTLQRWLNGVLRCSQCSHVLVGGHGNGGPRYWCARKGGGCGKIAVKASFVEDEVEQQVLGLLSKPRILQQLRSAADTETTTEARRELAEDEEQLKELSKMWARKEITFPEYKEARSIIDARVKESRALLTSRAPMVLRRLLAGDVKAGWGALVPADKREVVLALVPGYEVLPHDRSYGNKFNPARLVPMEWSKPAS
ncbi:recombinase family protein [Streptomyces sp. NBC_00151]|uniref:recombinase family protein n=1 Tax=Streptomyces sp. NBC_00151 TaxID=2975669 RepID=UPI002DDA035E|nr:recombinase family protein [Streptomyces sp. NBC_00151]WRZ41862.1 recombinase family protein [Streptomyces sp. NBC_00151]